MNKEEFIDKLNQVCLETNSPLVFHQTIFDNFQNMLKYGGIFSPEKLHSLNIQRRYLFGYQMLMVKTPRDKKRFRVYAKNIFLSFKTPSYKLKVHDISERVPITIMINPRDLRHILPDSHICNQWHFGKVVGGKCVKYNPLKSFDQNLERYIKYIDKKYKNYDNPEVNIWNELVISNPEGIVFDSLEHKPTIVIQINLLSKEEVLECKNLEKTHSEYNWIYIK